jgi:putative exosortase-associated protein (TIGR04073 family)
MLKQLPFLAAIVIAGAFATGCANTEQKLGRGMRNTFEVVRLGEMRRSMEQTAIYDGPETAYTTGFVRGLNRTLARTGVGIYEIVTCPIPPYEPVFTHYLAPEPVYPDNYRPELAEDSMFATDTNLRFSGGGVLPFVPGNRFRVFDSH